MNPTAPLPLPALRAGFRGMFNLNDPRWGRNGDPERGADDKPDESASQGESRPPAPAPAPAPAPDDARGNQPPRSQQGGRNQGPPDLDELWRDFNRKLGGWFGGARNRNAGGGAERGGGTGGSGGGGFQPDMKNAGVGIGLIAGIALLIWLSTGFFIVQEGQQAVITRFGRYVSTQGAGLHWRLPYPIERHESVFVTQIRSVDVGRDSVIKATGLKDSAMLTEDENIVEIKFAVQYRLKDARQFLFESKNPNQAVVQAAETAVREVVGKMRMDSALAEERDQIGPRVRQLMQVMLDRYKVGIDVVAVNLQQGGVRPPEQVQAAFDDVLKAGQERERAKNEAQAYANDVVPRAVGTASRLQEEASGYKARIVAQARGDAQRFSSVLDEYEKAPQVTRERMYLDTMQQILSSVSKIVVDSHQGSNLLYLPLDKIMQLSAAAAPVEPAPAVGGTSSSSSSPSVPSSSSETRSRVDGRSRERDSR